MPTTSAKKTTPSLLTSATGAAESRAQFRWSQVPLVTERTLAILEPGGKVEALPKEIGTAQAAEVLGCSIRAVQDMCDRGLLVEGRDWRKLRLRGARGEYRITHAAVLRLRRSEAR